MSRPPRLRLAALAATLLAATTVLGASVGLPEASAAGCGPAPSGRVAVALVVDSGGAPSTRCVEVPDRSTGYDVLIAAGHTLRIESGFLCAIDGVPATGCGNRPDFAGAYWRYFHAAPGGSWTYSSVGGGGYRMPPRCAVEGWRWSDAPSAATAPRVAPPMVTCEAPPPPPTSAARPAPPAAQATPPGTAPQPVAPSAGGLEPAPPPPPGASGPGSAPVPDMLDGGAPVEGDEPNMSGTGADAEVGDDPTDAASPPDGEAAQASVEGIDESVAGQDRPSGSDDLAAPGAAPAGSLGAGDAGGSPLGVLLGLGTILALGVGAAVLAARRRRLEPGGPGADGAAVSEDF